MPQGYATAEEQQKANSRFGRVASAGAQLLDVRGHQINAQADAVTPRSTYQMPYGMTWLLANRNNPATAHAVSDTLDYFAKLYGGEQFGSQVMSYLIEDPTSRQRTQAILGALAGYGITGPLPMQSGATDPSEVLNSMLTSRDPQAYFSGLDKVTQTKVQSLGAQLLQNLGQLPQGTSELGDRFVNAVGIAQNGYTRVMSPDEIKFLQTLVTRSQTGLGGTTQELSSLVGYHPRELGSPGVPGNVQLPPRPASAAELSLRQLRQQSGLGGAVLQIRHQGGGIIVLDKQWAERNPDQAFAVENYLKAAFPTAQVQYGREGVVGSLIDQITKPIDWISAPIGAGIHQLSMLGQEVGTPEGQRKRALGLADWLHTNYTTTGAIPDPATANSLRPFTDLYGIDMSQPEWAAQLEAHLRKDNSPDFSWSEFWGDLKRNTRPELTGFGFADNLMRSSDLLPGDPGYSTAYAVAGIAGMALFDPLNWGLPAVGGIMKAQEIPYDIEAAAKAAEAVSEVAPIEGGFTRTLRNALTGRVGGRAAYNVPAISQSAIENAVYARLARSPEEFITTRRFQEAAYGLKDLYEKHGYDGFVALLTDQKGWNPADARDYADILSGPNRAGPQMALMSNMFGTEASNRIAQEVFGAETRLQEVNREIEGLAEGADATDLLAERAQLESVLRGREAVLPAQGRVMSSRELARLNRAAKIPADPIEEAIASTDVVRQRKFFASGMIRHLTQSVGGDHFWFDHAVQGDQFLADMSGRSIKQLGEKARLYGMSDERFRQLIAPYVSGKLDEDLVAKWDWLNTTWKAIVDESPYLDEAGRQELRTLVRTPVERRAGGYNATTTIVNGQEAWDITPTLPRTVANTVVPTATMEGEMIRGVPLTTIAQDRSYLTRYGQLLHRLETSGEGGKEVNAALVRAGKMWKGYNAFWRATVLGTRVIALPARIISEEMLRMAAFDWASLVRSPLEWFFGTGLGARVSPWSIDQLAAQTVPEGDALGMFADRFREYIQRGRSDAVDYRLGLADSALAAGDAGPMRDFMNAYSGRAATAAGSPSTRAFRLTADGVPRSVDEFRALMEASPQGQNLLRHLGSGDLSLEDALKSWEQEMRDLVGTDPQNLMGTALRLGAVEYDGRTYAVGTREFGEMLTKAYRNGDWIPGLKVTKAHWGDDLAELSRFSTRFSKDGWFNMMLNVPDAAMARNPAYRLSFDREYHQLLAFGYDRQAAEDIAKATSARNTADMLFTLGQYTAGEAFLRQIMPFFPAYRELGTTWIARVPSEIGRLQGTRLALLGWGLGATELTLKARRWNDFFHEMGWVEDTPNGPVVKLPGMAHIIAGMVGLNPSDFGPATTPVSSAIGILPIPLSWENVDQQGNKVPLSQRLQGFGPSVGGSSLLLLQFLKNKLPGFDALEQWMTPYGADQTPGSAAIDNLIMGLGVEPKNIPWLNFNPRTARLAEAQWSYAVADGIRLAASENPPPTFDPNLKGDALKKAEQQYADYINGLVTQGLDYSRRIHFARALTSSVLPFSVNLQPADKTQMATMWQLINSLPDSLGGGPFKSKIVSTLLGVYPHLEYYMASKGLDTRHFDSPTKNLQAYFDAVAKGDIIPYSPKEYAAFATYSVARSLHIATMNHIREQAGPTVEDQLMMPADLQRQLDAEQSSWIAYNDFTAAAAEDAGLKQSPEDMWNTVQRYRNLRGGTSPNLTLQDQQLIDANTYLHTLSKVLYIDPARSQKFFSARNEAYTHLFQGQAATPTVAGEQYWYKKVSNPYYKEVSKLYAEAKQTPRNLQGPIYAQIADLSNKLYDGVDTAKWGHLPSPEAVAFSHLSTDEQQQKIAEWANEPGVWLTRFQREQVGYDIPPKLQGAVNHYSSFYQKAQSALDEHLRKLNITKGSNAAAPYEKQTADKIAAYAQELGLVSKDGKTNYLKQFDEPGYIKVTKALDLNSIPHWKDWIVNWVTSVTKTWSAAGASIGGQTGYAQTVRLSFENWLESVRDPSSDSYDERIAHTLTTIQATDPSWANSDYKFYDQFFFGAF